MSVYSDRIERAKVKKRVRHSCSPKPCARLDYDEKGTSLSYWRTQSGIEVDMMIARGKIPLLAAELKSHSIILDENFDGLLKLKEDYPGMPLYIVCTEPESRNVKGVSVLPWWEFLERVIGGLK